TGGGPEPFGPSAPFGTPPRTTSCRLARAVEPPLLAGPAPGTSPGRRRPRSPGRRPTADTRRAPSARADEPVRRTRPRHATRRTHRAVRRRSAPPIAWRERLAATSASVGRL